MKNLVILNAVLCGATAFVATVQADGDYGNVPSIAIPQGQQVQPQGYGQPLANIPCVTPTIAMPQGQNEFPPLGTIEARPSITSTSSSGASVCFPLCSTYYFLTSTTSCLTTTLPTAATSTAPSISAPALNRTQYLIFDKGFERSRDEAASFCGNLTLLSNGTILYPIAPSPSQAGPSQGSSGAAPQGAGSEAPPSQSPSYYGMQDFLNALQLPSPANTFAPQAPVSNNGTIMSMNSTLADVSNSILFRRLSGAIQSPVYIRSWQGDNYRDACIALFPGGAIAVPREGCQGPFGFICQLNPPSNSTNSSAIAQSEEQGDDGN